MSLLDKIAFFSNASVCNIWANGKYGVIIPADKNTYRFVEYEKIGGQSHEKYSGQELEDKSPILAYGFVYYWLQHRKRSNKFEERLDSMFSKFCGKPHECLTPKEIYDGYIEARKTWFFDVFKNRPDAWRFPDLEKAFYEQELNVSQEQELINYSFPLDEYLDEEDKEELNTVCFEFLEYLDYVIKERRKQYVKYNYRKEYERNIDAVFNKKYKFNEKYYWTNPEVINAFQSCINQNEPSYILPFIEACIEKGCAKATAKYEAENVVKALVGLGLLEFENSEEQTRYASNVSKKFSRMKDKDLSDKDQDICDSVERVLNRPTQDPIN